MLLINNLTTPGGIRRVEIGVETIKVTTRNGAERLYKLAIGGCKDLQGGEVAGSIDK